MLTSIEDFRDRIVAIVARVSPHLTAKTPEGLLELDRCRSEMSRILSIYNLFVHREIFAPLLERGTASEQRAARHLKAECICLTEEFRAFTGRWRLADVSAAWKEYEPEASAFRVRILLHIDQIMAISTLSPWITPREAFPGAGIYAR